MSFISTTDGKDGMRITSEDDGTKYNYCVKRPQKISYDEPNLSV